MPRFIIERCSPTRCDAVPRDMRTNIRLARSFSMGGKSFDVYIATDRAVLNRLAQLSVIPTAHIYG